MKNGISPRAYAIFTYMIYLSNFIRHSLHLHFAHQYD